MPRGPAHRRLRARARRRLRGYAARDRASRAGPTSTTRPPATRATPARRRTSAARRCSAASCSPPCFSAASSRGCRRSSRCACGLWALGTARRPASASRRLAARRGRVRSRRSPCGPPGSAGTSSPGGAVDLALTLRLGRRARQRVQPVRQHGRRGRHARRGHLPRRSACSPSSRATLRSPSWLRARRGVHRIPALQPRLARRASSSATAAACRSASWWPRR